MTQLVPGHPFVFGALLVILAILVAAFIPESSGQSMFISSESDERLARIRRVKNDEWVVKKR